MSLDPGGMVDEETVLGHDPSVEGQPEVAKEIAGKSPTQIAFRRLRQDKVAVVCFVVIVLLVLTAVCAPLITRFLVGANSCLPFWIHSPCPFPLSKAKPGPCTGPSARRTLCGAAP